MGWRYRKSVSLGKGVKLNLSRKGVGMSAGVKGYRFGLGPRGMYTSVTIPGTGISHTSYSKKSKSSNTINSGSKNSSSIGCFLSLSLISGFFLLFIVPSVGLLILSFSGFVSLIWYTRPKQRAYRKLLKAKKLIDQQNFKKSIELLKKAHKLDINNYEIIMVLGFTLHNSQKYEEAIKYLNAIVRGYPQDFDAQLLLANCHYHLGNVSVAIEILQKIPSEYEKNVKVIQLLGASFAAEKKYDLAIEVFKKAPLLKRNLDEDLIELHYNLGLVYEESGDKKNALKHFKKVYAQDISYRDVISKVESM